MACYFYSPNDVFLGVLGGCLESIDAGTTTIVDHAHMAYSKEICEAGAEALEVSGVRATYCITPTNRVNTWGPRLELNYEAIPTWWDDMFSGLAKTIPQGSGRIRLGLGYDSYMIGKDATADVFSKARKAGAKIITSHSVHSTFQTAPKFLTSNSMLTKDQILPQ